MLVDKAISSESTSLVFSNEGDVPLVWNFSVVANVEGVIWAFSGTHGELAAGSSTEILLTIHPSSLQARATPFVTYFSLNSSSPTPTPEPLVRAITTVAHVFVSAKPDARRSNVTLNDVTAVIASSVVEFAVFLVDSTGLVILDASQFAYTAMLNVSATRTTIACVVSYDASSDTHRGACNPPDLVAGDLTLEVFDVSGALVGGQAHGFSITDCPATYFLDYADSTCKCATGSYDKGSECAECPEGTVATVAGAVDCDACPARETSDATRARCDCEADYYRTDDNECTLCPLSQVDCAWGSTVANWTLKPGVWRSGDTSTDLRTCHFGVMSCPGETSGDDNCTARGFSDWPYCGCGYVGPTCAVCAPEHFVDWSGDACVKCGASDGHTPSIVFGSALVFLLAVVGAVAYLKRALITNLSCVSRAQELYAIAENKGNLLFFMSQVL